MDGAFTEDLVTFIATKKDDIDIGEVINHPSFSQDKELHSIKNNQIKLRSEKAEIEQKMGSLTQDNKRLQSELTLLAEQLELCTKAEEKSKHNEPVLADDLLPHSQKTKKRAPQDDPSPRKRVKQDRPKPSLNKAAAKVATEGRHHASEIKTQGPPEIMSADAIRSRTEDLESQRHSLQERLGTLNETIRSAQQLHNQIAGSLRKVGSDLTASCIRARDEWIIQKLREDFVETFYKQHGNGGVPMSDQASHIDPEALRVCCISSKAYQSCTGNAQYATPIDGFEDINTTGIPALEQHIHHLTEQRRSRQYLATLHKMTGMLSSLHLWSKQSRAGHRSAESRRQEEWLHQRLERLHYEFKQAANGASKQSQEILWYLFDEMDEAGLAAEDKAPGVVSSWGKTEKAGGRGIRWNTYKAILAGEGWFASKDTAFDFNEDLTAPVLEGIQAIWTQVFNSLIPKSIERLKSAIRETLEEFHGSVESWVPTQQFSVPVDLAELQQTHGHIEANLADVARAICQTSNRTQRELSRSIPGDVKQQMLDAYCRSCQESSHNMYARMKAGMQEHVEGNKHLLYTAVLGKCKMAIVALAVATAENLKQELGVLHQSISDDYTGGIIREIDDASSAKEETVRREVHDLVHSAEDVMNGKESTPGLATATIPLGRLRLTFLDRHRVME